MSDESCLWEEDEYGAWETSCEHVFEFFDGAPADNAFLFCPYCGKQLKTIVYENEETDDEETDK